LRTTVLVKTLTLSGAKRLTLTTVIPEGTCPMFITLPVVSCVQDCNVKSENNPLVSIYTPLAVKAVGLLIVKLMLSSEFMLTSLGAETLSVSIGVCDGVGVGEAVGVVEGVGVGEAVGVGVEVGSVMFVKVLAKK
jgi:hypothetical protein